MARYPNATGFLWTNDDVAISYWKLLQGNTSKLWMPNDPNSKETQRYKYELTTEGLVRLSLPVPLPLCGAVAMPPPCRRGTSLASELPQV